MLNDEGRGVISKCREKLEKYFRVRKVFGSILNFNLEPNWREAINGRSINHFSTNDLFSVLIKSKSPNASTQTVRKSH